MKLYVFPPAPNPRKLLTYLSEKGLDVPTEQVNLIEGANRTPSFLAKNPLGKLPVLELDDGSVVTESLAIIEYFEELHPKPSLWGTTPEERVRARSLERHCDIGVLMATARIVHATRSPLGLPPNPEIAENGRQFRQECLGMLDAKIADGPFVAGDRVTVGDCTLFGALSFGAFFDVKLDPKFANVTRWLEEFSRRPSTKL